jgi:hypothetical protein
MRPLLLLALLLPALARADAPPICGPAQEGMRRCMAQQVCSCGFDRGGKLAGRPPGWRWSCDIMQMCDTDAPADLAPPPPVAPDPLYLAPGIELPSPQPPPWRRP